MRLTFGFPKGIRILSTLMLFLAQSSFSATDGTTGPPLGGFGTGAIKFCAHNGTFAFTKSAPAQKENYGTLASAQFQFYSNRSGTIATSTRLTAVKNNARADDDAAYPVQTANLGTIGGVAIRLTGFAPIWYKANRVDTMCYPYAFFEVQVTNSGTSPADASVALQMPASSVPAAVTGKGFASTGGVGIALYAKSDDPGAVVSCGSDNGFMTLGICNNNPSDTINKVAVKVTLAAGQTRRIKFVYAWYNSTDMTRFFYTNAFSNAGGVAEAGLAKFDALKTNAINFVTRIRASNLPVWLIDQTLNSLSMLTNNSIYFKDERVCYAEGKYLHAGTMDQMWHARKIVTMAAPFMAWQELEFWARTQKTNGQIHHDFDPTNGLNNTNFGAVAWDDTGHKDYAYGKDINTWVDLNCGFIISAYEAYIATGDKTKLDYFWPFVKKAGQKILTQAALYGNSTYKYTFDSSRNTLDAIAPDRVQGYSTSLSHVAYKIMAELALVKGEPALATKYNAVLDTATASFKARYLTNNFSTGYVCGAYMAGQWMSHTLRLGDFYSKTDIDYAIGRMNGYYNPVVNGMGTWTHSQEWQPYLISHYGGLLLNTGNIAEWKALQYDMYNRCFLNRNIVFNHPLDVPPRVTDTNYLATDFSGTVAYMSTPVLWRNYYSLIGYYRNKHSGELAIKPIILPEMNHKMSDAAYISPEGMGAISCEESGANYKYQKIVFKPDAPITVTALYIQDKDAADVTVTVNGINQTFTRTGSGYSKELKINWAGTVDTSGITISTVPGTAVYRSVTSFVKKNRTVRLRNGNSILVTLDIPEAAAQGTVRIITPAGRVIRTIALNRGDVSRYDYTVSSGLFMGSGTYIAEVKGEKVRFAKMFFISQGSF